MESEGHLKNGIREVRNWTPPGLLGEGTDAPSLSNAPCRVIAPGLFQPFSAGTIGPAWVSAHTERFNSHSTRASEERILSFERIALFLPDNRGNAC